MAAVGSYCLLGAIAGDTLYIANLSDSRAILDCRVGGGRVAVVERLSNDHNVASEEVQMEVSSQNPDEGQIVVHTRGAWRIKGIIQVRLSNNYFWMGGDDDDSLRRACLIRFYSSSPHASGSTSERRLRDCVSGKYGDLKFVLPG